MLKSGPIGQQNNTCGAIQQGCGGSSAREGGIIAIQSLAIHVSRTTCRAISTNLTSGWFCHDHMWSIINESVFLIKQICGPT